MKGTRDVPPANVISSTSSYVPEKPIQCTALNDMRKIFDQRLIYAMYVSDTFQAQTKRTQRVCAFAMSAHVSQRSLVRTPFNFLI